MPDEAPSPWDPEQYERFKAERSRPFFDLLALVRPRPGMRVVDLGCGTGELTTELHTRLGARETVGIDSSETMLAKGAEVARESPFRESLDGFVRKSSCLALEAYAALLERLGFGETNVRMQVYGHRLE